MAFDLTAFDITDSQKTGIIQEDVETGFRLVGIHAADVLDFDDVDISHDIEGGEVDTVEGWEDMDTVFVVVIVLGFDDGFEVAFGIEVEAEGSQIDSFVGDTFQIKEVKENNKGFLLKQIVFFFFFFHRISSFFILYRIMEDGVTFDSDNHRNTDTEKETVSVLRWSPLIVIEIRCSEKLPDS